MSLPQSPAGQLKLIAITGAFLAMGIALLLDNWSAGRPVALPNVAQDRLACASYTPSHDGHTLAAGEKRALIESDLNLLARRFTCVRTYSVSEGLDEVPKVARALGLKVMLGLWISSDAVSNDKEIAHGIAIANKYADVVTAVVVGNEVLLRRELTADQLQRLMERVRDGTRVPVTYADVWEFWLRNKQLAAATDFVTIHILPYWEDQPIGVDHALDHVRSIYEKVRGEFPKQTVFVGETGWPSEGRPRLHAVPSLLNEARFTREFVAYAEANKIPYNLIEAFDQPWKRVQEGTVGGYWGLYDANAQAKFAFTGPVVPRPWWKSALLLAVVGAALGVALGVLQKPRLSARASAFLGIAGYVGGNVSVAQWHYLVTANRSLLEWLATCAWAASGWAVFLYSTQLIGRWLDGTPIAASPSMAQVMQSLGYGVKPQHRLLGLARFALLVGLAYVCIALVYDGRGRDFPIAIVALPIVNVSLLAWLTPAAVLEIEERLLTVCIALAALGIAWLETPANLRAMMWCVLCLALVAALWLSALRTNRLPAAHPNESAQQQPGAA